MTTMQEQADKLRERLSAENPEPWNIEEQPTIAGVFTRLEGPAPTRFGPKWIVILTLPDLTERSVWLFHTTLLNEFKKARPAAGEMVAIAHLGKKMTEDGRTEYDAYKVVVDRAPTEQSWDAVDAVGTLAEHAVATAAASAAGATLQPPPPPALPVARATADHGGPYPNHQETACQACAAAPGAPHAVNCPDDVPF